MVDDCRDIHGTFHSEICLPSPITLPRCCLSRSLPMQIPLQPCEVEAGGLQSRKLDEWQYLPRRILARRHVGLESNLQLNLANRASLKVCKSVKPKPPSPLALVRFSQEIQHIFFLSMLKSHQNLVKADWIRLYREHGSLKQDMVYVGIAAKIDFSMIIFPAVVKNLVDHLKAFWRIRSTIMVNRSRFFLPKSSGSPRYFPKPPSF